MYENFAEVYDLFMDNVPYDTWAGRIENILRAHAIGAGSLVCDLGCGTGQMTRRLRAAGYDMIGIDASVEMLSVAGQRTKEDDILYLCQDMRSFELYGTVAAIISVCDCMNYLTKEKELLATFAAAANYLDPDGLFLFDMNTPYYYRTGLCDATIAENRTEGSFIWENHTDVISYVNESIVTFFVKNEAGSYDKYTELHRRRAYETRTIRDLLAKAGFTVVATTDADTGEDVRDVTERVLYVAQIHK